jgi:hypothetical protein
VLKWTSASLWPADQKIDINLTSWGKISNLIFSNERRNTHRWVGLAICQDEVQDPDSLRSSLHSANSASTGSKRAIFAPAQHIRAKG